MNLKHCLDCRSLGEWKGARCPTCKTAKVREYESDAQRRAAKAARYGPDHEALRRQYVPLVEAGVIKCARCLKPIAPFTMTPNGPARTTWHLDHLPNGVSAPSHSACNEGAWVADRAQRAKGVTVTYNKPPSIANSSKH